MNKTKKITNEASVVVFGKPRAFESYEYVFGGETVPAENIHREPILKPKRFQDPILHYYVKDGFVGLEYYTKARGYDSERDGIVFGVALKSNSRFDIVDSVNNILLPFWADFANILLDESYRFLQPSVVDYLKNNINWSQDEIDTIQQFASSGRPISNVQKKILLLISPKIEDIRLVEDIINEYKDVYISDSPDVFKELLNDIVLREADDQICQIQNGEIVPFKETPHSDPHSTSQNGPFRRFLPWGKGNKPIEGASSVESGRGIVGFNHWSTNIVRVLNRWYAHYKWMLVLLAGILFAFVVIYFYRHLDKFDRSSPVSEGDIVEEESDNTDTLNYTITLYPLDTAKYPGGIMKKWKISPQIKPDIGIYTACDITYSYSDTSLVEVKPDDKDYWLTVKKSPDIVTYVTVNAYIKELSNQSLGSQTYKIAKKEEKTSSPSKNKQSNEQDKSTSSPKQANF